ncbi:MAG: type II toxin-antitoxin system VapC family toxin [Actinomycetota bacterium]|nr:type II toxin-antitoxin system VapC family toxin [Actinomycetota bacterium]
MGFFEDTIAALNRSDVRYVVVGGLAVVLHGHVRLTVDLDLAVDLEPREARRAVDVLTAIGLTPAAPVDLLDVGFIHALRRLVAMGDLSEDRAADVRAEFADLTIIRYPHGSLADRMWDLRLDLSAYDAAFVALAEALGVPLVSCDGRLARAAGSQAPIELFG